MFLLNLWRDGPEPDVPDLDGDFAFGVRLVVWVEVGYPQELGDVPRLVGEEEVGLVVPVARRMSAGWAGSRGIICISRSLSSSLLRLSFPVTLSLHLPFSCSFSTSLSPAPSPPPPAPRLYRSLPPCLLLSLSTYRFSITENPAAWESIRVSLRFCNLAVSGEVDRMP